MSKRTKQTSSGKRPKRRRPHATHRRVTPAVLDKFSDLWLQGTPVSAIARATGFNRKTVDFHIQHTIMPLWQRKQVVKVEFELARVEHIYKVAWEMFEKSTEPLTRQTLKEVLNQNGVDSTVIERITTTVYCLGEVSWLKIVTWCLDYRARVCGLYVQGRARARVRTQPSRVGRQPNDATHFLGKPLEEFDEEALEVMLQEMDQRHRYQESVKAWQPEQEQQAEQDDRVELDEQDDREGQEEENDRAEEDEIDEPSASVGDGLASYCGRSACCEH